MASTVGSSIRKHTDLKTFLAWAYAAPTMVDQTQSVFRGTLYEYVCQTALQHKFKKAGLGSLVSVGGAADRGIDLVGDWNGTRKPLNVAVQCKSSMTKVPPQLWREMAGVHMQIQQPALIILASPLAMTPKALAAFSSIDVPYLHALIKLSWPIFDADKQRPECKVTASNVLGYNLNPAALQLLEKHEISLPQVTRRARL